MRSDGGDSDEKLARGLIERIGGEAVITIRGGDGAAARRHGPAARPARRRRLRRRAGYVEPEIGTWRSAVARRSTPSAIASCTAASEFTRSVRIDDAVLQGIEDTIELAPLHNPHNLRGIAAARAALGAGVPQVAVFDTAFHQTLPEHAYLYAIPYQLYRRYKVRRYGFHGTSHRYIAYRWRAAHGHAREATRASSRCTSATAARRARSTAATPSTRRWASRRSRGW